MAASDNVSSDQFWGPGGMMFHISPSANRKTILKKGLVGQQQPEELGVGDKPGVFVSDEPHPFDKDFDVYGVNTAGLESVPDTHWKRDSVRKSHFIIGSVPPERVHLIEGEKRKLVESRTNQFVYKHPFREE